MPTFADLSTTHVSAVRHDGATSVTIEAGSDQGLQTGASVTLLRSGEEIIHPISGQVLGIPQEPVGLAEVRSVEAGQGNCHIGQDLFYAPHRRFGRIRAG